MPTANPRFSVSVPSDLYDAIEQFRFDGKYKSQNSALIALVEEGIAAVTEHNAPKQKTAPAPDTERELSDVDRQLIALPVEMKQTILELIEQSVLLGLSDSVPTRQASETTSRSVASQILAAADDQPESDRKDRQAH